MFGDGVLKVTLDDAAPDVGLKTAVVVVVEPVCCTADADTLDVRCVGPGVVGPVCWVVTMLIGGPGVGVVVGRGVDGVVVRVVGEGGPGVDAVEGCDCVVAPLTVGGGPGVVTLGGRPAIVVVAQVSGTAGTANQNGTLLIQFRFIFNHEKQHNTNLARLYSSNKINLHCRQSADL